MVSHPDEVTAFIEQTAQLSRFGAGDRQSVAKGVTRALTCDNPRLSVLGPTERCDPMEVTMTSTNTQTEKPTGESPLPTPGEVKLEVIVLPVTDVDRAKRFYENLSWGLDGDLTPADDFRVVQFTPPGSLASIRLAPASRMPDRPCQPDTRRTGPDTMRATSLARGVT
jgi:hypothetical protein